MKIVRSILSVVIGVLASTLVVAGLELVSGSMYPMPEDINPMSISDETRDKLRAWMLTLPADAFAIVLAAWLGGAFVGGGVSALIANRARVIHAGIVGLFMLLSVILNFTMLPGAHPAWMMIAGLVLPVPTAMLAGWLVKLGRGNPPPDIA